MIATIEDVEHVKHKVRRDMLRLEGRCICGPVVGFVSRNGVVHGPVVRGGRCQRCIDARKQTEDAST